MGYLYHLCSQASWDAATSSGVPYKPPTYDQDGFTHLTQDPALLIPVANTFYTGEPGDWIVLCLDDSKLSSEVKFEPAAPVGSRPPAGLKGSAQADEPLFPHLYGPINFDAVCDKLPVKRASDGTFLEIEGLAAK